MHNFGNSFQTIRSRSIKIYNSNQRKVWTVLFFKVQWKLDLANHWIVNVRKIFHSLLEPYTELLNKALEIVIFFIQSMFYLLPKSWLNQVSTVLDFLKSKLLKECSLSLQTFQEREMRYELLLCHFRKTFLNCQNERWNVQKEGFTIFDWDFKW